MSLMSRNTEHIKVRLESEEYHDEAQANILLVKDIKRCCEGINTSEDFTQAEWTAMY